MNSLKSLVSVVVFLFSQSVLADVGPQLFLTYGYIFDLQCAAQTGYTIKSEWQQEVDTRLSEFQNAWDSESRTLMQTLFEQTGKGFSRHELTVTLSVCSMVSVVPKKPCPGTYHSEGGMRDVGHGNDQSGNKFF